MPASDITIGSNRLHHHYVHNSNQNSTIPNVTPTRPLQSDGELYSESYIQNSACSCSEADFQTSSIPTPNTSHSQSQTSVDLVSNISNCSGTVSRDQHLNGSCNENMINGNNSTIRIPFSPSCGQAYSTRNAFSSSNVNVSSPRHFWSTCDLRNTSNARVVFPPSSDLVIGRNAPRASVMGLLGTLQIPNERNPGDLISSRSNSPETAPYVTISRYIPPTLTPGRLCNSSHLSPRDSSSPVQRVVRSASASTGLQPTPTLTRSPRPSPVLRISESYDSSGAVSQYSGNENNRRLYRTELDSSSNSLIPDFRLGERVPFLGEVSPTYSSRLAQYSWLTEISPGSNSLRLQGGGSTDTSRLTHLALSHLASHEPPPMYLHSPPPTYDQVGFKISTQLMQFPCIFE